MMKVCQKYLEFENSTPIVCWDPRYNTIHHRLLSRDCGNSCDFLLVDHAYVEFVCPIFDIFCQILFLICGLYNPTRDC